MASQERLCFMEVVDFVFVYSGLLFVHVQTLVK
jgi:hypothetical protein